MKTTKDEYPELYALACNIARDAIIKINERADGIKSECHYKQQCILELLIAELEKSV